METPNWTEVDHERWRAHFGPLRVEIHRHEHVPNVWLLTTRPAVFEYHEIGGGTVGQAQEKALIELRRWMDKVSKAIPDVPMEIP